MSATLCPMHNKLSYRSYGGACAAAGSYSTKRDTPLRVYHDPECCTYHVSSKINAFDFVGAA